MDAGQTQSLKVGDYFQFISVPDEWADGGMQVSDETRSLMHYLISEQECLEVERIDENGIPQTSFRMVKPDGLFLIDWILTEKTGWIKLPDLPA